MGEQHLDLLAIASRLLVLRCLCDRARDIPRSLVHAALDLAIGHVRTALLLHRASGAVVLAGAVDDRSVLGDAIARLGEPPPITQQRMSLRAAVLVCLLIPDELA